MSISYSFLSFPPPTDPTKTQQAAPDFEHELEVEISSAEVRRQGDLALAGDPSNRYEELVKGFIDNVRVLARAVPPY
jgi:hypothetical protein